MPHIVQKYREPPIWPQLLQGGTNLLGALLQYQLAQKKDAIDAKESAANIALLEAQTKTAKTKESAAKAELDFKVLNRQREQEGRKKKGAFLNLLSGKGGQTNPFALGIPRGQGPPGAVVGGARAQRQVPPINFEKPAPPFIRLGAKKAGVDISGLFPPRGETGSVSDREKLKWGQTKYWRDREDELQRYLETTSEVAPGVRVSNNTLQGLKGTSDDLKVNEINTIMRLNDKSFRARMGDKGKVLDGFDSNMWWSRDKDGRPDRNKAPVSQDVIDDTYKESWEANEDWMRDKIGKGQGADAPPNDATAKMWEQLKSGEAKSSDIDTQSEAMKAAGVDVEWLRKAANAL